MPAMLSEAGIELLLSVLNIAQLNSTVSLSLSVCLSVCLHKNWKTANQKLM